MKYLLLNKVSNKERHYHYDSSLIKQSKFSNTEFYGRRHDGQLINDFLLMFLDKTYFQPNKIKTIGKLDFTEKHRKYLEEKRLDEYINIVSPKQVIQKLKPKL